jgi:hypothetical protein
MVGNDKKGSLKALFRLNGALTLEKIENSVKFSKVSSKNGEKNCR